MTTYWHPAAKGAIGKTMDQYITWLGAGRYGSSVPTGRVRSRNAGHIWDLKNWPNSEIGSFQDIEWKETMNPRDTYNPYGIKYHQPLEMIVSTQQGATTVTTKAPKQHFYQTAVVYVDPDTGEVSVIQEPANVLAVSEEAARRTLTVALAGNEEYVADDKIADVRFLVTPLFQNQL